MSENKKEALEALTLDQVFAQMDEVLSSMEEESSLEKSFGLYHQGVELLKACNDKIDHIEKQIMILDQEGNAHEF